MLVEITGCSGAGKTSLLRAMLQEFRNQNHQVVSSIDVLARATGTARIDHEPARNLMLNVLLTGWFRRAEREHATFVRSARAHIKRDADPGFDRASRLLALRRQLAGDAILRTQSAGVVTLVDEGILGSIHSALVHPRREVRADEVEAFVSAMPKPDMVLHLDTPLDVCLNRTLSRPDPPLRWSDIQTTERYVRHGHQAYRYAGASPAWCGRWQTLTSRNVEPRALAREAFSFLHHALTTP